MLLLVWLREVVWQPPGPWTVTVDVVMLIEVVVVVAVTVEVLAVLQGVFEETKEWRVS